MIFPALISLFGAYLLMDDKKTYAEGGSTLLAPNGKPSNLNTEQWKLVRTPEFKAWFGDWENDPKNASKVVDENGEPLVMYHKSTSVKPYFEFDKKYINKNDPDFWANGFWFSKDIGNAAAWTNLGGEPYIRSFFLNVRNILTNEKIDDYENKYYDEIEEKDGTKNRLNLIKRGYDGVEFEKNINPKLIINQIINKNEKIIIDKNTYLRLKKESEDFVYILIEYGQEIDIIYFDTWGGKKLDKSTLDYQLGSLESNLNKGVVIAFESNQIKLADGSNTTFDSENPDIRYAVGGEIFYHGTPDIDLSGKKGIHIGTKLAATQALESRIGVPSEGEWDGTREYGKTLIAGKKRLLELEKIRGYYLTTGYNADAEIPENDYYPHERKAKATYSDGTPIPHNAKPKILSVRIIGRMTNTKYNPHSDDKANLMMLRNLKLGNAKSGYYYNNDSEDEGSISAVVPNKSFLQII